MSTAYCGAAYSLKARRLPSRALWPKYGSHCTHLAAGRRDRISSICAAMVGDATVSVRMRRPAPFFDNCALNTLRMATTKALNG